MSFYALNLFDLADNDSYLQYSRRSPAAVAKHDGRVVALGLLDEALEKEPEVEPRSTMILVSSGSPASLCAPFSMTRSSKTSTRCGGTGPKTTCGGLTRASTTSGLSSPRGTVRSVFRRP